MNAEAEVRRVLDEILGLGGRSAALTRGSYLIGAIPELDSMAVVSIMTALEERLGLVIDDDDVDGATFETFGSLVDFVAGRLAA